MRKTNSVNYSYFHLIYIVLRLVFIYVVISVSKFQTSIDYIYFFFINGKIIITKAKKERKCNLYKHEI